MGSNLVEKLPNLLKTIFLNELTRQWDRAENMDAEEFRYNVLSNIHYNLTPEDFKRHKLGIYDVLGTIEADLLCNYEHGSKLFRCITESELPVYSITVDKKLLDREFCKTMINNIPNVGAYILDKLPEFNDHHIKSYILETIRLNNMKNKDKIKFLTEYNSAYFDDTLHLDRLEEFIKDKFENKSLSDTIDYNVMVSEDSKRNIKSGLNSLLEDECVSIISYLENTKGSLADINSRIFQVEIDIINNLQELLEVEPELRDSLGLGHFYQLAHMMSRFVEYEVISFVSEILYANLKHNNVAEILSAFVYNYVKDSWK